MRVSRDRGRRGIERGCNCAVTIDEFWVAKIEIGLWGAAAPSREPLQEALRERGGDACRRPSAGFASACTGSAAGRAGSPPRRPRCSRCRARCAGGRAERDRSIRRTSRSFADLAARIAANDAEIARLHLSDIAEPKARGFLGFNVSTTSIQRITGQPAFNYAPQKPYAWPPAQR
jgi:hypothetical protein